MPFEGSTYGSVPARAGNKALESGKRIACMKKAVEVLKKGSSWRTMQSRARMPKLRAMLMKKPI